MTTFSSPQAPPRQRLPLPAAPQTAPQTALLAFNCIGDALAFLSQARGGFGAGLTAFELLPDAALQLIARHLPEQQIPLESLAAPWYALIEIHGAESETRARERFEAVVGQAYEDGLVIDATIAESLPQSQGLWQLRHEALSEAQRRDGGNIQYMLSVPLSRIPDFLKTTAAALASRFAGVRPLAFGDVGNGRLHYHVAHAPGQSVEALRKLEHAVHATVHRSVLAHGGSIKVEHSTDGLEPHA